MCFLHIRFYFIGDSYTLKNPHEIFLQHFIETQNHFTRYHSISWLSHALLRHCHVLPFLRRAAPSVPTQLPIYPFTYQHFYPTNLQPAAPRRVLLLHRLPRTNRQFSDFQHWDTIPLHSIFLYSVYGLNIIILS